MASSSAACVFGRGAVDLVGEQEVGEDGPGPELEPALALVVEEAAGDVARQQVGRELDAAEAQVERLGQEPGDEGLGEARVVLDQDVAVGEDAGEDPLEHVVLAHHDAAERRDHLAHPLGDGGDLHRLPSMASISAIIAGGRPGWGRGPSRAGGRASGRDASAVSRGHSTRSKWRRLRRPARTSSISSREALRHRRLGGRARASSCSSAEPPARASRAGERAAGAAAARRRARTPPPAAPRARATTARRRRRPAPRRGARRRPGPRSERRSRASSRSARIGPRPPRARRRSRRGSRRRRRAPRRPADASLNRAISKSAVSRATGAAGTGSRASAVRMNSAGVCHAARGARAPASARSKRP